MTTRKKTTGIRFRATPQLIEAVRKIAKARGETMSGVIRETLRAEIARVQKYQN